MPSLRLGGVALQSQSRDSPVLDGLISAGDSHQKLRAIPATVAGFPGLPQLRQAGALLFIQYPRADVHEKSQPGACQSGFARFQGARDIGDAA